MTATDFNGNTLSGADATSLPLFETAQHELRCFIGDPLATIDKALTMSPALVMGHVLKAYLNLLGTEPFAIPAANEAHQMALALPANERERRHLIAVRQLAAGRWRDAARTLEDISIDHPLDALALQAGHLIDFYVGDSRMLRDRIARALPAWSPSHAGYHAVLGMYAFGLEETGHYAQAEARGRRAVELEPRDTWAQHAVAHVMEMQGRQRDGIAWMRGNEDGWSRDSFFSVHNWWHLALYHLDLGEIDTVLELLDGPIFGKRSPVVLDLIDVSALLWRLHLRGIELGERWQALAELWAPLANTGTYAFNDFHAMMAFVGAKHPNLAQTVLDTQARAMQGEGDNVGFTSAVGYPAAKAIKSFGEGRYDEAVHLLRPIRNVASRFGGSHAQRDLIDLTLIEAALRSNQQHLAAALAAERLAVKPTSPLAKLLMARAAPQARAA